MTSQNRTGHSGDPYADKLDVDALIIGAGFGGAYMLHLLRKQGLDVKLYEAGKGFGGVWQWNRYPGARVDVELPCKEIELTKRQYGFSDPAIWGTWTWTQRYPDDTELRSYFEHVDKVWNLSKDVAFQTVVTGANYDNDGRWTVKTADGRSCRCTYLVAATGTSFKQYIPDWKGLKSFKGAIHHSSLWPEEGPELKGKKIAVVGAGSSGVQIVQEVAKVASEVVQFMRTPNFAIPMRQRDISEEEVYQHRVYMPQIFKYCRTTGTGLHIPDPTGITLNDSPEVREAKWDEGWRRGGFHWSRGPYRDYVMDREANRLIYDYWARKTRARITDPKKRDLLAPLKAPYWMGTKRPSLEQDYYEQCDRPHVEITNSPILELNEKGIVTKEKAYEFDIIAIATGYDAVTGGLATMGLVGKDGVKLQEKWAQGVATQLGLMVHGFPNMFIIYGPQAPTSLANGPPFIEMQCEWIADAISKLREEKLATMEAKKEAEDAWRETCLSMAQKTLVVETDSWYMGANVPGKKREFLIYMGGLQSYEKACREALDGWKGFDVTPADWDPLKL